MLTLVRMGFPADPRVVMLTTASPERVEALVREHRDEFERQGWNDHLLTDFLRLHLPAVEVKDFAIRGESGDEVEVSDERWEARIL